MKWNVQKLYFDQDSLQSGMCSLVRWSRPLITSTVALEVAFVRLMSTCMPLAMMDLLASVAQPA